MRKWRARDVILLAEQNLELVRKALERARDDCASGLGGGGDAHTKQTKWAAATSNRVLAISGELERDPVPKALVRLIKSLRDTQNVAEWLAGLDEKDAEELTRVPGAGHCVNPNCGRWCAGGPDRLRAGRCDRCRKYRARHAGREWRPSQNGDGGDSESKAS